MRNIIPLAIFPAAEGTAGRPHFLRCVVRQIPPDPQANA